MSPALRSKPLEEQNHNQDQVAASVHIRVSEDQDDSRCLLEGRNTHVPTVTPQTIITSYSSPSYSFTTSTSHLTPTHTSTTHLEKNSFAQTEDQNGNEESGCGEHQREEEGRKKAEPYNSVLPRRVRDLAAFWLLGFCNNFTYWVMISAAYDLLAVHTQQGYDERSHQAGTLDHLLNASMESTVYLHRQNNDSLVNTFTCHRHSTGTILVADTLPATALSLAAPLILLLGVSVRVWLLTALCVASYLVLGLASSSFVFLGVALASASRGFSDVTFLGYASNYHKHVLSLWASGTGVATFVGPLLFSAMTTFGLQPNHALLNFLAVPLIIVVSFWCVLTRLQPLKGPGGMERVDSAALVCEEEVERKVETTGAVIKHKIFLFRISVGSS